MRLILGQTINRLVRTAVGKTGQCRQLSSASELEKTIITLMQGFNQSKEDFVKNVCDDVIFLAPDEPIIKGKQAMAEWQSKGSARYGTTRLLSQTNCDFIGDNTCISVAVVEATNDKGEKMHYKNLQVWTKIDGEWRLWRVMFNPGTKP